MQNLLYLHAKMSTFTKVPEGLKDSECEKGTLGVRPPIRYVPPMDLLQTKENTDTLKVKLSDGTVFTMSIFAKGNQEDYRLKQSYVLLDRKDSRSSARSIARS